MTSTEARAAARGHWMRVRVMLAAGLVAGFAATSTLAGWTDGERASAEFTADVLPAPLLTEDCEYRPGVLGLGARVRIYWAPPAGYDLGDIEVEASTSGLGSALAPLTGFSLSGSTVQLTDGTYRTDVRTNLLGGLLGLGDELEIALLLAPDDVGGWTSEPASVASNAGLIAGLGGNCRNLT